MNILAIILSVCISTAFAAVCDDVLKDEGGSCKAECLSGEVENIDFGYLACLGLPSFVCCIPAPTTTTTPEQSTTMEPTTMEPTTTSTPAPPTTPAPIQEQCGVQSKQDSTISSRMFGGTIGQKCDWPWQVSIRGRVDDTKLLTPSDDDTRALCNGVLIDREYVLTTAFCVMFAATAGGGIPEENIVIVAGEFDTKSIDWDENFRPTETYFTVEQSIIHEDYIPKSFSDIFDKTIPKGNNLALLKLSRPVEFSDCIRKVCLTPENPDAFLSKNCIIAAWGVNKLDSFTSVNRKLHEANVTLFSSTFVEAMNIFNPSAEKLELLTTKAVFKDENSVACMSDNGGMVVCQNQDNRWELEGLINRPKFTPCTNGEELMVTDIRAAAPWIRTKIGV